jgi:hypothetical protein
MGELDIGIYLVFGACLPAAGREFGYLNQPRGISRISEINRLLKKSSFPGCSKRARCKAPEILRSEAYLAVRRNDEG